MKSINYEHAAQRKTFVGVVYEVGVKTLRTKILDSIDEKLSNAHREGKIHIHDLEAYGQTYNCLAPDILKNFPFKELTCYPDNKKILEIMVYYRDVIVSLGNEQSGGISFANFDDDIETIFNTLKIEKNDSNFSLLRECLAAFLKWLNNSRDRCGEVQYYVSINLGLSEGEVGRYVASTILETFKTSDFIRPNIVFKVKAGINSNPSDKNYDLFRLAIECTCKKMIPTYLLGDSNHNQAIDPHKIAIMGCRTKVYQNQNGEATSIGRSNIAYCTINLPRIALEINAENGKLSSTEKVEEFKKSWVISAELTKDLLIHRYQKLLELDAEDFPCNLRYNLRMVDLNTRNSLECIFKNDTLAIGFIGLSEAIEVLTGKKFYKSEETHLLAIDLVKFMRDFVDNLRQNYDMNFTLLATSGELISGRFPDIDKKSFSNKITEKGFYTNSFHVDVDSGLNPFEKLRIEGVFHKYCNGGCISYVEFQSSPISNYEAISELIDHAIKNDVNYLGFNFPLDQCRKCGMTGTFDSCEKCGSDDIQRIRRVSGYLEDAEFFTKGKKAEVASRQPNT